MNSFDSVLRELVSTAISVAVTIVFKATGIFPSVRSVVLSNGAERFL